MNPQGVVLFHTSSSAFRAEKILLRDGLRCKLIPTPREMSSDCGIALWFAGVRPDHVAGLLDSANVEVAAIHGTGGTRGRVQRISRPENGS
ncbi:DUF3343 domain-containing protein [Limnochorda pilosa]|uniref:DUF3343 domain-containing protein n=1 Tax=Limnochorda pilosa TaxID=1555112 RepID=UPI0009EB4997